MHKDRILPGSIASNLLPKELKEMALSQEILDPKRAEGFAQNAEGNRLVMMLTSLFSVARDAYDQMVRQSRDIPAENAVRNWLMAVGYTLIDDIIPVLQRAGKFDDALDLLDEYKKANPFFYDKNRFGEAFRLGFENIYDSLGCGVLRRTERRMIADLRHGHKGDDKTEKYERLFRALKADHRQYSFPTFFHALAAHVSRKPEDLDLLYSPDDEKLSAFIVERTIAALRLAGKNDLVQEIERKNQHLLDAA